MASYRSTSLDAAFIEEVETLRDEMIAELKVAGFDSKVTVPDVLKQGIKALKEKRKAEGKS